VLTVTAIDKLEKAKRGLPVRTPKAIIQAGLPPPELRTTEATAENL
jgi:hypothetical protein